MLNFALQSCVLCGLRNGAFKELIDRPGEWVHVTCVVTFPELAPIGKINERMKNRWGHLKVGLWRKMQIVTASHKPTSTGPRTSALKISTNVDISERGKVGPAGLLERIDKQRLKLVLFVSVLLASL